MAKRFKLTVGGIDYVITSDSDEAYVHNMGDELNRALDGLSRAHPYLSTTMVAVLTALQYLDESHQLSSEAENLRIQMKNYVEDAACARLETEEARREIDRLNRENRVLRDSAGRR